LCFSLYTHLQPIILTSEGCLTRSQVWFRWRAVISISIAWVQFGSLRACLRVYGSEIFIADKSRMVFFLVIPRINLVVMRGAGGGEGVWASCIDSGKVLEAGVVVGLLIEFELSLVKVKKDGSDSCLLLEQEVEEVEEVIMVGVKIYVEVSLVGEG